MQWVHCPRAMNLSFEWLYANRILQICPFGCRCLNGQSPQIVRPFETKLKLEKKPDLSSGLKPDFCPYCFCFHCVIYVDVLSFSRMLGMGILLIHILPSTRSSSISFPFPLHVRYETSLYTKQKFYVSRSFTSSTKPRHPAYNSFVDFHTSKKKYTM